MNTNGTSSGGKALSPQFVTYVTASVVLLVFLLTLCIFCLALEICRRKKSRRRLPHILRSAQRSKKNHYDKSPVLSSVYYEDGNGVDPGYPNPGFEEQEVGFGDQGVTTEPEYDCLQDDGYLRPDCNSDRLVSVISLPDNPAPVPYENQGMSTWPSGLPRTFVLPPQSSCDPGCNTSQVSGSNPFSQTEGSHNATDDEATFSDLPEQEVNPLYATVPEVYNQGIYSVANEPSEFDYTDHASVNHCVPPVLCVSSNDDDPRFLDQDDQDVISLNLYDNNVCGSTLDKDHLSSKNVADAGRDDESDDGQFLTIEDVVHSYERIPARAETWETFSPPALSVPGGHETTEIGMGDKCDNDTDSIKSCLEHVYEDLPDDGPNCPMPASEENGVEIVEVGPKEENLYENYSFLKDHCNLQIVQPSLYVNVKHDSYSSEYSHSPYLPMDGTLKKVKVDDVYLPMGSHSNPNYLGIVDDPNDPYSYAHVPGHSDSAQAFDNVDYVEDTEIYSTAGEDGIWLRPVGESTDEVEFPIQHPEEELAEPEDYYEVINAGVECESIPEFEIDQSRGIVQYDNVDACSSFSRSFSLNNIVDLPAYYNDSPIDKCSSVHWGSLHDLSVGNQLVLRKDSNEAPAPVPAPRTLSRTFTTSLASLDGDSSAYSAYATSDFVFVLESEA